MVPNGHLERAGEAPFARTRAAGWDTRWGTAGPGTSWVHRQEAVPCYCWQGSAPTALCMGAGGPPDIAGPPAIPGGGGRRRGYVRLSGLSRQLERPSPHNLRSAKTDK